MKKLLVLCLSGALLFLSSFKSSEDKDAIGTYGKNGVNGPQIILNADHSFSYRDMTNQRKTINTKGKWEYKNGTVILKDYESNTRIINKWKLVREGKCLKGKKALTYYTLCDC